MAPTPARARAITDTGWRDGSAPSAALPTTLAGPAVGYHLFRERGRSLRTGDSDQVRAGGITLELDADLRGRTRRDVLGLVAGLRGPCLQGRGVAGAVHDDASTRAGQKRRGARR